MWAHFWNCCHRNRHFRLEECECERVHSLRFLVTAPADHRDLPVVPAIFRTIYRSYRQSLDTAEQQTAAIREHQEPMIEYCRQMMLEQTHEVDATTSEKLLEFDPIDSYRLHFCAVYVNGDHRSVAEGLSAEAADVGGALCNIVHYARFTAVVFAAGARCGVVQPSRHRED